MALNHQVSIIACFSHICSISLFLSLPPIIVLLILSFPSMCVGPKNNADAEMADTDSYNFTDYF